MVSVITGFEDREREASRSFSGITGGNLGAKLDDVDVGIGAVGAGTGVPDRDLLKLLCEWTSTRRMEGGWCIRRTTAEHRCD